MATSGNAEAFPSVRSVTRFPDGGRTIEAGAPGMTLREWYAGRALQGIIAASGGEFTPDHDSRQAVRYADALLKVLGETP